MSLDRLYGTEATVATVREAVRDGDLPVAVYGLGKMGLPLAGVYADVTGTVTGVDVDEEVASAVARGDCPVDGEPGLPELVERTVASGALSATTDGSWAATRATVHVIVVPTLVRDRSKPDLSNVRAVATDVGRGLEPGDVVFVESTVPPRTCADVIRPLLAAESGLATDSFGLAFCPERTSSGRALRDIRESHPKIVGGVDDESTRIATAVYDCVTDNDVIPVSDAATAECVKVFEGVYRDVNIALANELARFTDELGVDVNQAIEAANTQPYCDLHSPGAGVGGHCIPYYPYFLVSTFGTDAPLLRTARAVNDGMPAFTVRKLAAELAAVGTPIGDATVLLLGLTYRPGVAETRESPARDVARRLARCGTSVYAADPMLDDADGFDAEMVSRDEIPGLDLDAAVLVTDHDEFDDLDWEGLDELVVVDGRNALDLDDTHHRVYTIGSG